MATHAEINEQVALKLGYEHIPPGSYYGKRDKDGNRISINFVQPYCDSIAAAWEICLFLKPLHFVQVFEYPTWCGCDIIKGQERYSARADTAPMAICLAYLKL